MRLLASLLLVGHFMAGSATWAADAPAQVQAVFDRLGKSVDVDWKRKPLGDVLGELAAGEGLRIRIDESAPAGTMARPVTFHAAGTPLGAVVDRLADRFGLDTRIGSDGEVVLFPVPGAKPVPDWVDDPQPVRLFQLGRYRRLPPPNGWDDPVAPLGDGDEAALGKPNPAAWQKVIAGEIDRIEAYQVAQGAPSAELVAFLKAHPDVRSEFWRALDPRFDDAKAACRIMDELRAPDEKRFLEHKHLAIAAAVVFDTPEAAVSSRYNLLWAVRESQFGTPLTYTEVWQWFTDPRNQQLFVFKPSKLAWPLLVHQVDLDVDRSEIDWAVKQYAGKKLDLQALYGQVPYDYGKLAHSGTKLGDQPYTLANLRSLGGVCVDQAHFASRIAKLFGVPSLKCGGNGRYGGVGHAWSGYLAASKSGAPELTFTGRYQFDFYYLGTAFDPQTRTEVLDRDVELLYAGVCGKYESFSDATLLARIARGLEAGKPEQATAVAREAVKRNPYVAEAWRVLLRTVPAAEADRTWQNLAKALPGFPDVVAEGLRIALDRIPADDKGRQKLYEACYALCGAAKRPDLQIQVRLGQLDELAAAKQDEVAIQKAFDTVRANVKEGTLIMPLVKRVVSLANRFAEEDPKFRMGLVKDTFAKLATDFPKQRGNEVSPAWMEWQQLVKTLK